jgi:hypothetical protein
MHLARLLTWERCWAIGQDAALHGPAQHMPMVGWIPSRIPLHAVALTPFFIPAVCLQGMEI